MPIRGALRGSGQFLSGSTQTAADTGQIQLETMMQGDESEDQWAASLLFRVQVMSTREDLGPGGFIVPSRVEAVGVEEEHT